MAVSGKPFATMLGPRRRCDVCMKRNLKASRMRTRELACRPGAQSVETVHTFLVSLRVQRGFVHLGKMPRHFNWMQECTTQPFRAACYETKVAVGWGQQDSCQ